MVHVDVTGLISATGNLRRSQVLLTLGSKAWTGSEVGCVLSSDGYLVTVCIHPANCK